MDSSRLVNFSAASKTVGMIRLWGLFLIEAMPLFSRKYLLSERETAVNSGFNKSMGDSLSKRLMASF